MTDRLSFMPTGRRQPISCTVRGALVMNPELPLNCRSGPLGSEGQVGREFGPESLRLHCPGFRRSCGLYPAWYMAVQEAKPAGVLLSDRGRMPAWNWLLSLSYGEGGNHGDGIRAVECGWLVGIPPFRLISGGKGTWEFGNRLNGITGSAACSPAFAGATQSCCMGS